jgi:hypothetical protein
MSASDKLVNVVCDIFWVVATALTTDADRRFFLAKHNQNYFNEAKHLHGRLLVLESAGQLADSFDINLVLSDAFGRWLNGNGESSWSNGFSRPPTSQESLPSEWVRLMSVLGRPNGPTAEAARNQLRLLKGPSGRHEPKLDSSSFEAISKAFMKLCTEMVLTSAKERLEQEAQTLQHYHSHYEEAALGIIGKQVRCIERPKWSDLAASTRLTLINLVDKACNDDGDAKAVDCFEAARQGYRAAAPQFSL